jgi:hypothetical protein
MAVANAPHALLSGSSVSPTKPEVAPVTAPIKLSGGLESRRGARRLRANNGGVKPRGDSGISAPESAPRVDQPARRAAAAPALTVQGQGRAEEDGAEHPHWRGDDDVRRRRRAPATASPGQNMSPSRPSPIIGMKPADRGAIQQRRNQQERDSLAVADTNEPPTWIGTLLPSGVEVVA